MPDIKNLQSKNEIEKEGQSGSQEVVPDLVLQPQKQEQIVNPEQNVENINQIEPISQESQEAKEGEASAGSIIAQGNLISAQKEREKQIENILESGLEEIYLRMSPEKQQKFKAVGEQTAQEINKLLDSAKVKVKQIIDLIKKWLSLIPGVNKFFLEQEAKIKADKIMELSRKR